MQLDEFWQIVEQARADAGATTGAFDDTAVAEALVARLTELSRDAILDFDAHLGNVSERLDTRELAMACAVITGYLSDDSFSSFRAGLIGLGRATVEHIIADPDSLADHPVVIDIADGRLNRMVLDSEELLFAASTAYTELSDGDEDAFWKAALAREASADPDDDEADREPRLYDQDQGATLLPRLSALMATATPRTESAPDEDETEPQTDPDDRCLVCGSVLHAPRKDFGRPSSISFPENAPPITREYLACMRCRRVMVRTKETDGWGAWGVLDPDYPFFPVAFYGLRQAWAEQDQPR